MGTWLKLKLYTLVQGALIQTAVIKIKICELDCANDINISSIPINKPRKEVIYCLLS
jgi:hypothetical protein